jgi:F0F1-type ATP synthase assembly protein I
VAEPPEKRARYFADVLSFGWVLPASLAAGAGFGWLLDKLLGTKPVLTIVLALLGGAGGLVQVYKEMVRISEDR